MTTTLITLDGVAVTSAPVLERDCSFPITDFRRYNPADAVVNNFPVLVGWWGDGMTQPGIKTEKQTIDRSAVADDCDSPTVKSVVTSCYWTAPNMALFDLKTDKLELHELIPAFCRQRNIVPNQQLNSLLNRDGTINQGNPYAVSFAKFAYNTVALAMWQWITQQAIAGDTAVEYDKLDGLYAQIDGGWTDGAGGSACGNALNLGQTIDWGALTTAGAGPYSAVSLDAETVTGKTVTLWGTLHNVPVGYNFARFMEDFYIPAAQAQVSHLGDIEWEAHVGLGRARCLLDTTACMQPCNLDSSLYDQNLRDRFAQYRNSKIARLYPSGTAFPMMETEFVSSTTLRFGPRSIGGNPTYGLFLQNMREYFSGMGMPMLNTTYGRDYGMVFDDDPMLREMRDVVKKDLQSIAFVHDVNKLSHKCVEYSVTARAGVLATSRHLWLKVTNVLCDSFVSAISATLDFVDPA